MNFKIQSCPALDILEIRAAVLRPGRPISAARFDGDDLETTLHFIAFLDDQPLGAVSYFYTTHKPFDGFYQLRGMAVSAQYRGKGYGEKLVQQTLKEVRSSTGVENFWCNARIEAQPFYRRLGWEDFEDIFWVSGIGPHIKMRRQL